MKPARPDLPVYTDADADAYLATLSPEWAGEVREIYESWRDLGWSPQNAIDLTFIVLAEKSGTG